MNTRTQRRAFLRQKSRRGAERECHAAVTKIVELGAAGFSPRAIASAAGVSEGFVADVLTKAREINVVEPGGEGGTR